MKFSKKLKLEVSHAGFIVIFTTLLYAISNALNFDKLAKWFYLGGQTDYSALAAYMILGLSMFMIFFMIIAHRWTIKPLSIFLIITSAAATYFISKYNIAISRSMIMNTVHTDATEVGQLLSFQMIPYVIFLILIPSYLVIITKINFHKPVKHIFTSVGLGVLAFTIGTTVLYMEFNSIHQAGNISKKYIIHSLVPVNFLSSSIGIISDSIKPVYSKAKGNIDFEASVSAQQDLIVVLAIGETARQKSFSLYGYDRKDTNPVLSNVGGLHLLNGIARKGSTLYALPEILEKNGIKLPLVTSKAGIDTACYVNFSLYDNCKDVGEIEVSNCKHGKKCYDEDVIPLLEENLSSYESGYRFVVLHLGGGSHGPVYNDRVPSDFHIFKPDCSDADVINQCTKEELYNSYDNTIVYTDYVLGQTIEKLESSDVPYVLIYLSDHGESLLEEGRIFHGMPPGITLPPEQAEIPLIIKSSIPISIVEREKYNQQDVYDTVLDLFSIEAELFNKDMSFIKKLNTDARHANAPADEKAVSSNTIN